MLLSDGQHCKISSNRVLCSLIDSRYTHLQNEANIPGERTSDIYCHVASVYISQVILAVLSYLDSLSFTQRLVVTVNKDVQFAYWLIENCAHCFWSWKLNSHACLLCQIDFQTVLQSHGGSVGPESFTYVVVHGHQCFNML